MDQCVAMQQTTDGGYILAGNSESTNGDVTVNQGSNDVWLVKTDAAGTIVWQKSYGGSSYEYAYSVLQTSDGGYIMAGSTGSNNGDVTGNHGSNDFWVVKTDAAGVLQWQKCYGGTSQDIARSIQPTSDGGYIICGGTGSSDGDVTGYKGSNDIWVIKINATGTIGWQKCLGGAHIDEGYKAIQTADGGYMVGGYSSVGGGDITGNHGIEDFWVVRLDASGTIVWQKSLGGPGEDRAYAMDLTSDGGCVIAGYTTSTSGDITSNAGYQDCWIVKVSSTGSMDWQKTIGGSFDEQVFDIKQTADGGYILATATESTDGVPGMFLYNYDNYFILKLDNTGAIQWKKQVGGQLFDIPKAIVATTDGNYIVAGSSNSTGDDVTGNHGSYDYWVVKLSPSSTAVNSVNNVADVLIYPNPATTELNIINHTGMAIILDLAGRVVSSIIVNKAAVINISGLSEGGYIIKLTDQLNAVTSSSYFTKL